MSMYERKSKREMIFLARTVVGFLCSLSGYHKTAGKVYYCSDTISTIVTYINRLKGTKEVCESRMNKLIKKYVDSNQNKITYLRFETEKKTKNQIKETDTPPPSILSPISA